MTTRRELYALGEPFGDGATRAKLGGGYVCGLGGGGDSNSSSATTTNTTNVDKRQVVDTGSVGVTADNSTINVTTSDMGAIANAKDIAIAGITTNSTNTDHLLSAAQTLFATQQKALETSASLANALAQTAMGQKQTGLQTTEAQVSADKKHTMYAGLAVAGLVAVTYFRKKK